MYELRQLTTSTSRSTLAHAGMLLRCATYLALYWSFAQPRAVLWQMYLVTLALSYCCTGIAYVLSVILSPAAAQLTAAVTALINALVASKFSTSGPLGALNSVSYARWGLEGYVIAEARLLDGVWLLARCADLSVFHYDISNFGVALRNLVGIGLCARAITALLLVLRPNSTG